MFWEKNIEIQGFLGTPWGAPFGSSLAGRQFKKSFLKAKQPGYSGIDGARNLLNDMIYESLSKCLGGLLKVVCVLWYLHVTRYVKEGRIFGRKGGGKLR